MRPCVKSSTILPKTQSCPACSVAFRTTAPTFKCHVFVTGLCRPAGTLTVRRPPPVSVSQLQLSRVFEYEAVLDRPCRGFSLRIHLAKQTESSEPSQMSSNINYSLSSCTVDTGFMQVGDFWSSLYSFSVL